MLNKNVRITKVCGKKSLPKLLEPPMQILYIAKGCFVTSFYFTLYNRPSFKSTETIKRQLFELLRMNFTENDLWIKAEKIFPKLNVSIPKKLKQVDIIPMDHFINEIEDLKNSALLDEGWFDGEFDIHYAIACAFVISIVAILIYYLWKRRTSRGSIKNEKSTKSKPKTETSIESETENVEMAEISGKLPSNDRRVNFF